MFYVCKYLTKEYLAGIYMSQDDAIEVEDSGECNLNIETLIIIIVMQKSVVLLTVTLNSFMILVSFEKIKHDKLHVHTAMSDDEFYTNLGQWYTEQQERFSGMHYDYKKEM